MEQTTEKGVELHREETVHQKQKWNDPPMSRRWEPQRTLGITRQFCPRPEGKYIFIPGMKQVAQIPFPP